MYLGDQVCSLELAKRLKELGVVQDSIFSWMRKSDGRMFVSSAYGCDCWLELGYESENAYSAFTSSEIGEMLPDCIDGVILFNNKHTTLIDLNGHFIKSSKKDNEYKIYIDGLTKVTIFFSKKEADARAKMLIYLIENGLVKNEKSE